MEDKEWISYYTQLITDESDNAAYLSDMDTYELLYLNRKARDLYRIESNEDVVGKKCYKVLQGEDAPCSFCTNHLLNTKTFYVNEYYNPFVGKYSLSKDRKLQVLGRNIRLEIAVDITEKTQHTKELKKRLTNEEMLVRCIHTLNGEDVENSIQRLLKMVGEYYCGDRTYIFEYNEEKDTYSNTYEWCAEDAQSNMEQYQDISQKRLEVWFKHFDENGKFCIKNIEESMTLDNEEYEGLSFRNITSIAAATLVKNNKIIGFIGVDNLRNNIEDLTLLTSLTYFVKNDLEKRRMMLELERMSFVDLLTGLYNRNRYNKTLQNLEQDPPKSLGIVYVDMNGLKEINDSYGHDYGDFMIQETANLIQQVFDKDAYRIGGDEFIALRRDMQEEEFRDKVDELHEIFKQHKNLNVSIGSHWNEGDFDIHRDIAKADELMYIEKQNYYNSMTTRRYNNHALMARNLLKDIKDGAFEVYLQPYFEIQSKKLVGAEALVRKREHNGKLRFPDQFLRMYEEEKIIRHIDFFVLDTVCKTLKKWKDMGKEDIRISVNFSRVTLQEYKVVNKIKEVCKNNGITSSMIDIEITENHSKIMDKVVRQVEDQLMKEGFTVVLDDYGTHFSNLTHNADYRSHRLKVDGELISNLEDNTEAKSIVRHTIDMYHELKNTSVIAKGIESKKQLNILEDFSCEYAQGYYFSKPLSIEDFENGYIK